VPAPALPLRAPDRRRGRAQRRLPAPLHRPDRLRRPLPPEGHGSPGPVRGGIAGLEDRRSDLAVTRSRSGRGPSCRRSPDRLSPGIACSPHTTSP
jgi:hypothetical protein